MSRIEQDLVPDTRLQKHSRVLASRSRDMRISTIHLQINIFIGSD